MDFANRLIPILFMAKRILFVLQAMLVQDHTIQIISFNALTMANLCLLVCNYPYVE